MRGKTAKVLRNACDSRQEYRKAKSEVKKISHSTAQVTKSLRVRKHKLKAAVKPSWPCSEDQRKQGRPLIVEHPVRLMGKNESEDYKQECRRDYNSAPKWVIDKNALMSESRNRRFRERTQKS